MIKEYYWLTKPGIIYGNVITAAAGFFFASKGNPDWKLLLATLIGISLVIASACVINNIYDKEIDARMERTKNRAIVSGKISKKSAWAFALILLVLGIIALHYQVNQSALIAALVGFLVYTLLYTPLKHQTVHATLIGAVAGATPIVSGYVAVTNQMDQAAWLLFIILLLWQMPHFYAIGIRRLSEYKSAGIPILPAVKSILFTKINILIYIILFIAATILLFVFDYTGRVYLWVMLIVAGDWLVNSLRGFRKDVDEQKWAKKMFFFSLLVLLVFCAMISIDGII